MSTLVNLASSEEDENSTGHHELFFKSMLKNINSIKLYKIQFQDLSEKVNDINVTWARMETIGAKLSRYCMEPEYNIQTLCSNLSNLLNFHKKFKEEVEKYQLKMHQENKDRKTKPTVFRGDQSTERLISTSLMDLSQISAVDAVEKFKRQSLEKSEKSKPSELENLLNEGVSTPRRRLSRAPINEPATSELSSETIYSGSGNRLSNAMAYLKKRQTTDMKSNNELNYIKSPTIRTMFSEQNKNLESFEKAAESDTPRSNETVTVGPVSDRSGEYSAEISKYVKVPVEPFFIAAIKRKHVTDLTEKRKNYKPKVVMTKMRSGSTSTTNMNPAPTNSPAQNSRPDPAKLSPNKPLSAMERLARAKTKPEISPRTPANKKDTAVKVNASPSIFERLAQPKKKLEKSTPKKDTPRKEMPKKETPKKETPKKETMPKIRQPIQPVKVKLSQTGSIPTSPKPPVHFGNLPGYMRPLKSKETKKAAPADTNNSSKPPQNPNRPRSNTSPAKPITPTNYMTRSAMLLAEKNKQRYNLS